MILKKEVSIIFPSEELGRKIASDEIQVQQQVLTGFANRQMTDCLISSQPIISLVAVMPVGLVLWFVHVYQEIVKQGKISAKIDKEIKYNSPIVKEACNDIKNGGSK